MESFAGKRALASQTVVMAHEFFGLSAGEIGCSVGASRRTVRRWLARTTTPNVEHQVHLDALRELVLIGRDVFVSAGDAQIWLQCPLPAFQGRTARSILLEGSLTELAASLAGVLAGSHI